MPKLSASSRLALEQKTVKYHNALLAPEGADHYSYLREERGLEDATIRRFRLGAVLDDDLEGSEAAAHNRISIPFTTPTGVVSIRYRQPPWIDRGAKYWQPAGSSIGIFNTPAIALGGREVWIVEGECFPPDAEVFTEGGWVRFDQLQGQRVAQWSEGGHIEMVQPIAYIDKEYEGDLVQYEWKGYSSTTTPGHRMPRLHNKKLSWVTAEDGSTYGNVPRVGQLDGAGIPLTDDEIRLLLAVAADFTIRNQGGRQYCVAGFSKSRKVERVLELWGRLGISGSSNPQANGVQGMCFHLPDRLVGFKRLPAEWLALATLDQRELILDELIYWDGNSVPGRNQTEFSSVSREDCEWVQTMAHMSGRCSSVIARSNQFGSWFKTSILHGKQSSSWQSAARNRSTVRYSGRVYCVKVPSGAIMVRQNGHITVSGNCDAMIACQLGLPAVGYPGASSWKDFHREVYEGFERVYIIGDNDETPKPRDDGTVPDMASEKFCQKVANNVPDPKIMMCPRGHDLSSFFVSEGEAAVREHFKLNEDGGYGR